MSLLERHFPKFRSANLKQQEKIVMEAADHIKKTWTKDVAFDRNGMIGVCDLSAKLDHFSVISSLSVSICSVNAKGHQGMLRLECSNGRTLTL